MVRAEENGQTDRLEGGFMVKSLTVQCPHCHQVSDIYLSTNACVIVLNCPTCMSAIMYFEKKIFLLNDKQVDAIKDTTHNAAIMRMLDRIAHPEIPVEKTEKVEKTTAAAKASAAQAAVSNATQADTDNGHSCKSVAPSVSASKYSGRPQRDRDICSDDVTNLKIDLALCDDSQAFIDSL